MTRAEHLAWAKQRALEYCDRGQRHQAFASLVADLKRHPETAEHGGIDLGMMELYVGGLETTTKMRAFIEGLQ